jgi:hypothetical protein
MCHESPGLVRYDMDTVCVGTHRNGVMIRRKTDSSSTYVAMWVDNF